MPNYIHGILVLSDMPVGAGLVSDLTRLQNSNAKPAPTNPSESIPRHGIPEIIRGFKTFSARRINQRRKMAGVPVWQRHYYDRTIRNDRALQQIRQYIHNNPLAWHQDQLHPACLSKKWWRSQSALPLLSSLQAIDLLRIMQNSQQPSK